MTTKSARPAPKKSALKSKVEVSKSTAEVKKTKIKDSVAKTQKDDGVSSEPVLKTVKAPKQAAKQSLKHELTEVASPEPIVANAIKIDDHKLADQQTKTGLKAGSTSLKNKGQLPISADIDSSVPMPSVEARTNQKTSSYLEGTLETQSQPSRSLPVQSGMLQDSGRSVENAAAKEKSTKDTFANDPSSLKVKVDVDTRSSDGVSGRGSIESGSGNTVSPNQVSQTSVRSEHSGERNTSRAQQFDARDHQSRNHGFDQNRRDFGHSQGSNGNRDSRSGQGNFGGQGRNGFKDESFIEVKVSGSLYRKLREIARNEGLTVEEFSSELLAEGCVVRAWEVIERKAAMKGQAPNNNQNQARNNNGYNSKQNYNPRSKQGRNNYNKIMEDNAHFLEYVRNQEKRQR